MLSDFRFESCGFGERRGFFLSRDIVTVSFLFFNGVDASKFKLIIRDLVRIMRGVCILIINYGWSGREVSKRNFRV